MDPALIISYFVQLVAGLLLVVPFWQIYKKAGFSPYWSFLLFIPGIGTVLAIVTLAMTPWPAITKATKEGA